MSTLIHIAADARKDISKILNYTKNHWSYDSMIRYDHLIRNAQKLLSRNPNLPYSYKLSKKNKIFHALPLWLVPQPDPLMRVKRPPHILFYQINPPDEITIVRILHRNMNHQGFLGGDSP